MCIVYMCMNLLADIINVKILIQFTVNLLQNLLSTHLDSRPTYPDNRLLLILTTDCSRVVCFVSVSKTRGRSPDRTGFTVYWYWLWPPLLLYLWRWQLLSLEMKKMTKIRLKKQRRGPTCRHLTPYPPQQPTPISSHPPGVRESLSDLHFAFSYENSVTVYSYK